MDYWLWENLGRTYFNFVGGVNERREKTMIFLSNFMKQRHAVTEVLTIARTCHNTTNIYWKVQALLQILAQRNQANSLTVYQILNKLLVVDLSISVNICISDHFIDILIGKILSQAVFYGTKLSGGDETISIPVKHSECFNEFLFAVVLNHVGEFWIEKFGEVEDAISVWVDLRLEMRRG